MNCKFFDGKSHVYFMRNKSTDRNVCFLYMFCKLYTNGQFSCFRCKISSLTEGNYIFAISLYLCSLLAIICSTFLLHTVQEWLEIKFYCLWLFSTFLIHTWWGQSKYVKKNQISRGIFEKNCETVKYLSFTSLNSLVVIGYSI